MFDFTYFFSAIGEFPEKLGIPLYGTSYLIWMAILLIYIILIGVFYTNLEYKKRTGFKKGFALFIILLELARQLTYVVLGRYRLEYLPLHLCGITEFMILIYAFKNNRIAKESLYALGIVGALMALLFADWLMYPILHFQSIQSFIAHGSLMAFIWMLIVSKELKPNYKLLPWVFGVHVVLGSVLFFFNKQFNTNFFFLNYPSPGSPLEIFEQIAGNPGYILLTIGLVFVVWLIMYLPWMIFAREKKKYVYKYSQVSKNK